MMRKAWAAGMLMLLMVAGIAIFALHWQGKETIQYYTARNKPYATAVPVIWPNGTVNVNTADAAALQTLTGISKSQIKALLKDREENGSFDYPEDLLYIKGIGEKTLAKIYNQLDFSWRESSN